MSALEFIIVSQSGPRRAYRTPALAIAAARAGAVGVIDLEFVKDRTGAAEAAATLARGAKGGYVGLRCRSGSLAWQNEQESRYQLDMTLLHSKLGGAQSPVIVLTAGSGSFDEKTLGTDIAQARKAGFRVLVEAISLEEARLAERCNADAVIAKGHEAAGRVGDTTTYVAVQQFVKHLSLPVFAQGGIGLRTAAAVAAAGAAGVVLDSQLYLCRDSQIPGDMRLRMQRFDGSETTLINSGKQLFRVFAGNGAPRGLESGRFDSDQFQARLEENIDCENAEEELWLMGQDACFARSLSLEGGTVSGCIDAIRRSVTDNLEIAARGSILSEGSDLSVSHGTKYPIVQGAMTRVSDTSEFAHSVAAGGALPFLALSLMRGPDIEALLKETREKLGTLPWGVGILGFVPHALRQEQMDVVNRYKPPFALIAGGRPDQAKALDDAGTRTYLHVPSPLLLKSFIEMGSTRFIFEGKECGGHVGPRSSFVLWESMIDVLLELVGPRNNPSQIHVLFAGGIHDDLSAAMVAALAAPLTARGMKVGVLVGTAYLFTEEAVSTGAIVDRFQKAAIDCQETVLLETGPGHSIRCVESPYKETFDRKRVELEAQKKSRDEVREEMELMNLGRLRIASKGVARKGNELEQIAEDTQWQDGMYMIGQVAALHEGVTTIAKLHDKISAGAAQLLSKLAKPATSTIEVSESQAEGIAIVGMSCMFPEANDLETYWQNILDKVDTISEIPETHFDWRNFYDADPLARDMIVSKWGGFLKNIVFDPSIYGIPPSSLDFIDPMQVLILESARTALEDAGYSKRKFPRDKTSVILANAGHGPVTALYSLRSMLGWKLSELDETTQEKLKSELPEWSEDSFAGYLGNVTAGRVSNRFDLKGLNFGIDAACASSLAALYVAINDLRAGASDVVLLGATDTHNQPGDYLSFSKTHALSPKGRCQTFDANADGIVISEGIAMLVLKRVSDAERDGDRIYAVIRGIGGSSDGRDLSLTAPRPAGQMLALERAYQDAGLSASTVGLVEAHGTGTVAGDKAEVEALTKVFQASGAEKGSCAIGSVKTNIGHTKAAAGLASLVKVAKSLHHKILPPTINVKQPNPACKFGEGPFYLNTECRPWVQTKNDLPRRAGVSAFGFGGTNFHAIIEEYRPALELAPSPIKEAWPAELFVWKGASKDDLLKALKQMDASCDQLAQEKIVESEVTSNDKRRLFDLANKLRLKISDSPKASHGLAIVASSLLDLKEKIATAREKLAGDTTRFSSPAGIHFAVVDEQSPKIAYLFPGQGSQRIDMLKELSQFFPEILQTIESADRVLEGEFDQPLSDYIFPRAALSEPVRVEQQQRLTETEIAQPALGACDLAMLRVLEGFGIKPDMVAGHSYGEYVALHAAGVLGVEQFLELSAQRGRILAQTAARNPGAMAAISHDVDSVNKLIESIDDVYLANINTPKQCIISGATEAVDKALKLFAEAKVAAKMIPVSAAFHSPLLAASREPLREALSSHSFARPDVVIYSNTTAKPYEVVNANEIVELLSDHALKPVRFSDQLESMYEAGARIFIEVGPGGVLTGLTEATLAGKDIVAHSVERARKPLEHFLNVIGSLVVHGAVKDVGKLFWNRMPKQEAVLEKKKTPLLYRVNSVKIDRVVDSVVKAKEDKDVIKTASGGKDSSPRASINPTQHVTQNRSTNSGALMPSGTNGNLKGGANPPIVSNTSTAGGVKLPPVTNNGTGNSSVGNTTPPTYLPAPPPTANFAPVGHINQPVPGHSSGAERVMLEFQKNMLDMTNRFLETQQNVMLAYLQAGRQPQGQTYIPIAAPQVAQLPQTYTAAPTQGNNGNQPHNYAFHAGSNGDNGFGHHPVSVAPVAQSIGLNHMPSAIEDKGDEPNQVEIVESTSSETQNDSGALNTEFLIESLFEIVSERTGYPRQMLDPTLDLEADLGIDSIKRVEILNNFRKLLPEAIQNQLESGIEKLAAAKSLEGIIAWIQSLNDSVISEGASTLDAAPEGDVEKVARGLVTLKRLPAANPSSKPLAKSALIVSANTEAVKHLEKALQERQVKTVAVSYDKLLDETSAPAEIASLRKQLGRVGCLIHVASDSEQGSDAGWPQLKNLFLLVKELGADLKEEAATGTRAAFISTTNLGGEFSIGLMKDSKLSLPSLTQQAGLVGFAKTVAKELTAVHVKAIDFETNVDAAELAVSVIAELTADDDLVEIGIRKGERLGIDVIESPFSNMEIENSNRLKLTSSSVVLVTGGARGITAEITLDLARRHQPTFILVGRLPRPTETEAPHTAGLESPKDLKAAIMEEMGQSGKVVNVRNVERAYQQLIREREVRSTLARLKAAGSDVRYCSVDVTDESAFGQLIDSIYETSNIDGIIHGAGIIEDAYIKDKSLESFERVFHTKVKSAITLAQKVRFDSLQFMYLFSSVVGRTGNAGQCDYVAANEAVNKIAGRLNEKAPGRIASLMWGPWQAGMAPPELEEVFASHGWSMIQPQDGRLCFFEELSANDSAHAEVLLVGKLSKERSQAASEAVTVADNTGFEDSITTSWKNENIKPRGIFLHRAEVIALTPPTFAYTISVKDHRYLADHKFDGIPVMPMAMALEMLLEAAKAVNPGLHLVRVSNMDIPQGIVFHTDRKDFHIEASPNKTGSQISLKLLSTNPSKAHFRCVAHFATEPNTLESQWTTPDKTQISTTLRQVQPAWLATRAPQPQDVYGKWLFHGPIFQGIENVVFLKEDGISGRLNTSLPSSCLSASTYNATDWIMDPVLLDSAMQLAGIWARHYRDVTVLPTGFKTLHFFGKQPVNLANATAEVFLNPSMMTELTCDLAIYNESGQLAIVVEGLGGIASKAFNRFSSQEPAKVK